MLCVVPTKDRSIELSDEVQNSLTKCLEYRKPPGNPEPPHREEAAEKINSVIIRDIPAKDLTWAFQQNIPRAIKKVRLHIEKPLTPFWRSFNYLQFKPENSVSIVGIKPIEDAPADMVCTTMKHNQKMS